MRVYVEPAYDVAESFQLSPTLLLFADEVVFYGAFEAAAIGLRGRRRDTGRGAMAGAVFRTLVERGCYRVVARGQLYDRAGREEFLARRRGANQRPLPYDDGRPLADFWTETDDLLVSQAARASFDLSLPYPHIVPPALDSPLCLLPDEFNTTGDRFIEICRHGTDPALRALPGAVGNMLRNSSLDPTLLPPVREGMLSGEQRVRDFVNDQVAMAAARVTAAFVPEPLSTGFNATQCLAEARLAIPSAVDAPATLADPELLVEGPHRILEAAGVVHELPARVTNLAELDRILLARDSPKLLLLRHWLNQLHPPEGSLAVTSTTLLHVNAELQQLMARRRSDTAINVLGAAGLSGLFTAAALGLTCVGGAAALASMMFLLGAAIERRKPTRESQHEALWRFRTTLSKASPRDATSPLRARPSV